MEYTKIKHNETFLILTKIIRNKGIQHWNYCFLGQDPSIPYPPLEPLWDEKKSPSAILPITEVRLCPLVAPVSTVLCSSNWYSSSLQNIKENGRCLGNTCHWFSGTHPSIPHDAFVQQTIFSLVTSPDMLWLTYIIGDILEKRQLGHNIFSPLNTANSSESATSAHLYRRITKNYGDQ